ncbi:MAG: hypothetical protein EB133_11695 [Betaproteobacteria bacterium]|nr:hypothetical protein [Betaproteobacteria bacterium]
MAQEPLSQPFSLQSCQDLKHRLWRRNNRALGKGKGVKKMARSVSIGPNPPKEEGGGDSGGSQTATSMIEEYQVFLCNARRRAGKLRGSAVQFCRMRLSKFEIQIITQGEESVSH